jgi:MFS family permease
MFLRRFIRPSLAHFVAVYGILFFVSAQLSLALYTNSSFLSSVLNTFPPTANMGENIHERLVGLIYGANALVGLISLILLPRLLRKIGNVRATEGILVLSMLSLSILAFSDSGWMILPAFLIQSVLISAFYFVIDVFLEQYSKGESLGLVRGTALTIGGLAWMFPPAIAGIIAGSGDFTPIYAGGAVLLIPALLLLSTKFKDFKDVHYHVPSVGETIKEIRKNRDISGILSVQFLLQFFYAWMIIYAPIYMSEYLHIPWATIGLALTIALSAFVLFEIPAGEIADKWLGEKELLVVGLLLMALGAGIIPFIQSTTLAMWGAVLFIGRMGASILETMTETYFFKKIPSESANLVSAFRLTTPLAFLIAPVCAAVILPFGGITSLFLILATLLLLGTTIVAHLKDTK